MTVVWLMPLGGGEGNGAGDQQCPLTLPLFIHRDVLCGTLYWSSVCLLLSLFFGGETGFCFGRLFLVWSVLSPAVFLSGLKCLSFSLTLSEPLCCDTEDLDNSRRWDSLGISLHYWRSAVLLTHSFTSLRSGPCWRAGCRGSDTCFHLHFPSLPRIWAMAFFLAQLLHPLRWSLAAVIGSK